MPKLSEERRGWMQGEEEYEKAYTTNKICRGENNNWQNNYTERERNQNPKTRTTRKQQPTILRKKR